MSLYSAVAVYSPIRSALVNLPGSVSGVLFNSNIVCYKKKRRPRWGFAVSFVDSDLAGTKCCVRIDF